MRNKTYYYTSLSGKGNIYNLVGDNVEKTNQVKTNIASIKFKNIDTNILLGAIECFDELRFDILKEYLMYLQS